MLEKDVNSFITIAESDAYFENRIDAGAYINSSTENKEMSAITATSLISLLEFEGYTSSASQSLSFPREGSYYDGSTGRWILMNPTPQRVLNACFELQLHLLQNTGVLDDEGSVKSIDVDGIVLTNIKAPAKYPAMVMQLLLPLLSKNTNMWWRAN